MSSIAEKGLKTYLEGFNMFGVVKRDGTTADFNLTKISDAIMKAFNATDVQYNNDIVDLLSLRVTADFQGKVKDGNVHVEDIQDSVEKILEQAGYTDAAKAFILYRKQRAKKDSTCYNIDVAQGKAAVKKRR